MEYTIVLATDHRGYYIKEFLKQQQQIGDHPILWSDAGAFSPQRSDYPEFAIPACHTIMEGKADLGVFICGTGIGMAIVANRFSYLYSGVVWDETAARLAREDDNVNVLALPADWLTNEQALNLVHAWLSAQFKGGRYADRLQMIDGL